MPAECEEVLGLLDATLGVLETDVLHDPPYGRDTISADYGNGAATATASLVGSSVRFLDLYGRPATRFAVGETIFIRVVAPLRNTYSGGLDQISFQLTADNWSDAELLYVWETGPDTGVFEGSLPTAGNPPVQGDGTLETAQGQAVLGEPVRQSSSRQQAVRVRLERRDGGLVAVPNGPQGSHVITSLLGADALALIPIGEGILEPGTVVELQPLPR